MESIPSGALSDDGSVVDEPHPGAAPAPASIDGAGSPRRGAAVTGSVAVSAAMLARPAQATGLVFGGPPPPPPPAPPLTYKDAARFLTQATFGITGVDQVIALQAKGLRPWIDEQIALPAFSHSAYVESQRGRDDAPADPKTLREEYSYEAFWQHWLRGADQLRARVAWALAQIFVVSNIAPDVRPVAMSSYMDVLTRNAFGNFATLLREVTLHPTMGYYLNMLESEKEDPVKGTHPNENYAREVLQLFSIGLLKLNTDGSSQLDAAGRTIPTYDEEVVRGYAKAFSGWSFGLLDNTRRSTFHGHDKNDERLWRVSMQAWAMWHSTAAKPLLNGRVLPAGQTAEKDMADALDSIFRHPNVGPFIARQLIQRLVTSNPSPGYIQRVALVFNNNGAGVRGDLAAVVKQVLLDAEARGTTYPDEPRFGKLREPVVRFAAFLRGLGATSINGRNDIHYLDDPEEALAQSPMLAPSVFNFYAPGFRPPGPVTTAGMVAPEFQITSETSIVGGMNFFNRLFQSGGYGSGDSRMRLNQTPLRDLAPTPDALIDRLDQLFFCTQMSANTRTRLRTLINAIPVSDRNRRVRSALTLVAMSPDFVIQK
ncbi:MAG: DUF1800 domain-containing protein [Rubrivivax sp.]|nr:DUF1800 domain-containing protein [Rubrivivax sp.]